MRNYLAMNLYAASPGRAFRQILSDLLFLAWIAAWYWAARTAHEAIGELAGPGHATMDAADSMSGQLREVGQTIGGVPLVGDELTAPFSNLAEQADGLGAAGAAMVETVENLALAVGLAVLLIPVLLVAVVHVPLRVRFARAKRAARRATGQGAELFALRALTNQPPRKLNRVTDDPIAAWRTGDEAVLRQLADLELRSLGVKR